MIQTQHLLNRGSLPGIPLMMPPICQAMETTEPMVRLWDVDRHGSKAYHFDG